MIKTIKSLFDKLWSTVVEPVLGPIFTKHPALKEFIKYGIVGVSGTLIDVVIFELLYRNIDFFDQYSVLAKACGFSVAVVNNYLLNKYWTFGDKRDNHATQFTKFLSVALVGLAMALAIYSLYHNVFGIHKSIANLMTSATIVFWNFFGSKLLVFRKK